MSRDEQTERKKNTMEEMRTTESNEAYIRSLMGRSSYNAEIARNIERLEKQIIANEDLDQPAYVKAISENIDKALAVGDACTVWASFRGMTGSTDAWQRALAIVMGQKDLKRIKNPGEYSQYDVLVRKGMS